MPDLVIYTDLDGSLLDHRSYSHAPADDLLAELESRRIPVVPVSSKTRAELLALRSELGNPHPFIVENGAAVLIPVGYFQTQPPDTRTDGGFWVKTFSKSRDHWLQILALLGREFPGQFQNFAGMSLERIVALTGLTQEAAALSADREYGEPLHWTGNADSRQRFIQRMEESGAQILQGGRFLHVTGGCDKGAALQWLHNQYQEAFTDMGPASIAVGDSGNDIAMLEAADYALIIRSPTHPHPRLSRQHRTLLSREEGPAGWAEGVNRLLQSLSPTRENIHV